VLMKGRKLTADENEQKRSLSQNFRNCDYIEKHYHHLMQNPVDGVISFESFRSNIPNLRGYLANCFLAGMATYFCEDGRYLFDNPVHTLKFNHIYLKGYDYGEPYVMPDGTPYIAQLIERNPCVKCIDLSYTGIGDKEAACLIKALASNNNLVELKLDGNDISKEHLQYIALILKINKENANIKNTRINWDTSTWPVWRASTTTKKSIDQTQSGCRSPKI
jgi:hypothetical protein